jgi:hypothetical protein
MNPAQTALEIAKTRFLPPRCTSTCRIHNNRCTRYHTIILLQVAVPMQPTTRSMLCVAISLRLKDLTVTRRKLFPQYFYFFVFCWRQTVTAAARTGSNARIEHYFILYIF